MHFLCYVMAVMLQLLDDYKILLDYVNSVLLKIWLLTVDIGNFAAQFHICANPLYTLPYTLLDIFQQLNIFFLLTINSNIGSHASCV